MIFFALNYRNTIKSTGRSYYRGTWPGKGKSIGKAVEGSFRHPVKAEKESKIQ